ncbi:MAG: D-alanine--D-alanine ligase [Alphaproteobacteria bacterium]
MNDNRKKVAVFFGGRSPEHDVSVVTGLQVLGAIDESLYDAFPVYIDTDGEWRVGDVLRDRNNYMLDFEGREAAKPVTLDPKGKHGGCLIPKKKPLFGAARPITFDIAMPCFHGLYGEDGGVQGLFDLCDIPYTGMRAMASSILMDKAVTKKILASADIPVLPCAVIHRPRDGGYQVEEKEIKAAMKAQDIKFPCIIKPSHLGSSIGVAKVTTAREVKAVLPTIFQYDAAAILEPFVDNLVEYNVAISRAFGEVKTSAIERPKTSDELLDFKQKYLSGQDNKMGGNKLGGTKSADVSISEGMLSLTRELNPKITKKLDKTIREYAQKMFEAVDGTGAPRIDFIGNEKTGEIWLNEVNPIPGSFGYFLWEAAEEQALFTDFLTALLNEAEAENIKRILPKDPVPKDARLLKR